LNGTHQLQPYVDVILLGDNTDTIKKNTETLIDASKEVRLETEKTMYMLLFRLPNTGQNRDTKIAHTSFENRHSSNIRGWQ
jgi:ABC-type siderophore export system fused ATPase/permease subunit